MTRKNAFKISRKVGRFKGDRRAIWLLALFAVAIAGWGWLERHPQHNPWAPLDLRDPIGMATATKMVALKDNVEMCRATLERSEVVFGVLPTSGDGACERSDRTQLSDYPLAPSTPAVTCPVAAGLEVWRAKSVAPAARTIFGSDLATIEHLGAYSCRRLYGRDEGPWSEHATSNAIDIAAFVLKDGRRISVLRDWNGDADERKFLREVRDGACGAFATVLSPDYNAAHADHFHFDQQSRWSGACR
ncbi:extensin-like domain-containing protein [Erythrobacter crassostreae]|uniref:Extensin family protein n=1 Tax=Erythrobacter crassostreae TaxID=2828328 RepID=A0A9X1F6S5_9SPHN|nr:extensin family protein [Erythrobacter crassostrea]MBV7259850.1 extensin family protein [Erythrobacter crassostrea]